ncbi:hypothetical protein AAG906_037000 [Vitis piasezkii]
MKFEKAPNGSGLGKPSDRPGAGSIHPKVEEEAEIREMEDGLDLKRTLSEKTPHVPDHAPWMDLSAQISSLGTRMEELAPVHDSRFYSMEEHLDQYQTGVTSRFDHFQQRFERIEERMDQECYLHHL